MSKKDFFKQFSNLKVSSLQKVEQVIQLQEIHDMFHEKVKVRERTEDNFNLWLEFQIFSDRALSFFQRQKMQFRLAQEPLTWPALAAQLVQTLNLPNRLNKIRQQILTNNMQRNDLLGFYNSMKRLVHSHVFLLKIVNFNREPSNRFDPVTNKEVMEQFYKSIPNQFKQAMRTLKMSFLSTTPGLDLSQFLSPQFAGFI